MSFLYLIILQAFHLGIHIASLFDKKAALWVKGRQHWKKRLENAMLKLEPGKKLWIHCASLGEFEQGRPLIEAWKKRHPDWKIILTFFSPSGYEVRKNYNQADLVLYLPMDAPSSADSFLELINPDQVIFVKYEFWYFFLRAISRRSIPLILVSGIFREDQVFFKWHGGFFRKMLEYFSHFFLQNKNSVELLKKYGFDNSTLAGDTRVDRVVSIAKQVPAFPVIADFVGQHPVMVIGSSWPADEKLLSPLIKEKAGQSWKFIIAPHEVHEGHLQSIENILDVPVVRYAVLKKNPGTQATVLLIDKIGILSQIYQYGRVAYIGGGFGKGIHNILEPAAFGLPILFGPKFKKFEEAVVLVNTGGAFFVKTSQQLLKVFEQIDLDNRYEGISQKVRNYILNSEGATNLIVDFLEKKL